jgi:chemotaxis family two-component system response regulator Rcp1
MSLGSPPTPLAILAIEDSPTQLFFIRRVLDRHGFLYTLQVIADGTHALHFFDQLAQHTDIPCPDLLLLDLHLPGCPGKALLQRFKAIPRCARSLVIIVTASVEPIDRTDTLALGADAFFHKPCRFAAYMELGHLIKHLAVGGAARRGAREQAP